ncbi:MAG: hypothetical protein HY709_01815 [Candidatus Latescibacteria bacterium]|nr:hypothetical protein [Candidatus Latescibacterota bacterium]
MKTEKVERAQRLFEQSKAYAESVFDPEVNLCYTRMNWKTHMVRDTLLYALALFEGEDQAEIKRAMAIVEAVISTQNLDPESPHVGSYKWNWEDTHTGVMNAAEFIAPPLIHVYLAYPEKVPEAFRERVLRSIEKAQVAIKNRMLHLNYTNIALLSIFAQLAGGESLNSDEFLTRGYHRFNEWITQTNTQGAPTEFNSPTYTAVDLFALAWMRRFVQSEEVRIKARIMEERLWAQLAVHYHPPTKQLGGPWSRGYQNDVVGGSGLVKMILYKELGGESFADFSDVRRFDMDHNILWGILAALLEFHLPDYLRSLFDRKAFPYLTRETTDVVANEVHPSDITTYQTASFSLGSAGYNYHFIEHANNLLLHFQGRDRSNVLYTRLHLNDEIYGTSQHGLMVSFKTNDNDQGVFRSVQEKGKVIGLYGLRGKTTATGVRVDLVVPDFEGFDEMWVGDERIEKRPYSTDTEQIIFLRELKTCVAIRPLTTLCPWPGKSVWIDVVDGYLYISIIYYRGEEQTFGKRDVKAGFMMEVVEAEDDRAFEVFRKRVQRWEVTDQMQREQIRDVFLKAEEETMRIRWDLDSGRILDRWINGQFFVPPMFVSPTSKQDRSGRIEVGDAVLKTEGVSAWLSVGPEGKTYIVVNPELVATPVTLETPYGVLQTEAFGFGKITWRVGEGPEVETVYPLALIERTSSRTRK